MNSEKLILDLSGTWIRRAIAVVLAGLLAPVAANAQSLAIDFSSPATNDSQSVSFEGDITYLPQSMTVTPVVLQGSGLLASSVSVTGSGSNQRVTVTRLTGVGGLVEVRLDGSSGGTNLSTTFEVYFEPNQPPAFSGLTAKSLNEDQTGSKSFTVSDPDTPLADLVLGASSSNPGLIDVTVTNLSGTGSSRSISLFPVANSNGVATINLTMTDGESTTNSFFVLTVVAQNDAPTMTGGTGGVLYDNAPAALLPTAVVVDVDDDRPDPEPLTVTVQTPSGVGLLPSGTSTEVLTGRPSPVTTSLQSLVFTPIADRSPPGTTNSMAVTVSVNDGTVTVPFNRTVALISVNDAPTVVGTISPSSIIEGATVQPFVISSIIDPDVNDDLFNVLVEFVDPGQSALGHFVGTNGLSSASEADVISFVQGLSFATPTGVITGTSEIVKFRYLVRDGYGGSRSITNSLVIVGQQTSPTIFGVPIQTVNLTDSPVAYIPFPTASVSDPDDGGNQYLRAVISQSNPALGTFAQTNFSLMSPVDLTADLRALTFTPTSGVLPVNTTGNTILTITVWDATGLTVANNNVILAIKAVNNAPQILGIPLAGLQPVLLSPQPPVQPFAQIGLTSDDANPVTVEITLDNAAKGVLTDLGSFVPGAPGVYAMTGSISNVLHSLTNIAFEVSGTYLFPTDDPGGTVFSIRAADSALLTTIKTLAVQVQDQPRNHLVTRTANDGAPGSFVYALSRAGNNDVITFALPSYPAIVRMPGVAPSLLTRNVTIKGPGANLLTISGDGNGDTVPDRQIFVVGSRVTIEGVTLAQGTAANGGAIRVSLGGTLTLRDCSVVDSVATYYGGAIEVDGGQLTLEGCFIGRNSVSADDGAAGGGISIYSDREIRIVNTTFSGNRQLNESGDGGGAMVVENRDTATPLSTYLTHCTFAENTDASGRASSVLSISFGTRVRPRFCLFMDQAGRNLNVSSTAEIISLGGNISDDSSRTRLTQSGQSEEVYLLDHVSDLTNTVALLAPLVLPGDPTPYYPLLTGSPAIGRASGSLTSTDQRGVIRQSPLDSGAIEFNASRRLVINEIGIDSAPVDFIEIYVRRDSAPIDLAPYSLFVDGVKVHDFSNSLIIGTNATFHAGDIAATLLNPGFGIVVAFTNNPIVVTSDSNPTAVVRASVANVNLEKRSTITIGLGGAESPIARSSYLDLYLDPVTGTNAMLTAGNSISLAPQFFGYSLVPHSLILQGPFAGIDPGRSLTGNPISIGKDSGNTPFGQDNAEPLARPDYVILTEDDVYSVEPLVNDFDGDGNDRLFIVNISPASAPATGDVGTTNSALGALLEVTPATVPLRGTAVRYDPRKVAAFQSLPVGVEIFDTFYYEVIDVGAAPVEGYPSGTSSNTTVVATSHRLVSGDSIILSGSNQPLYNNTFVVQVLDDNTFTVPVPFIAPPAVYGSWQALLPRSPSTRSQASVSVKVAGVNDAPVAFEDLATNVTEISRVRIMTRPELAGTVLSFPSDHVPTPVMLSANLLGNDFDVDTDESSTSLRVVGILGSVHPISGYSGTVGQMPVIVHSSNHGLTNGDEVLIANYGGHPSYNGNHAVTVIDTNTFSLSLFYVDNDVQKGLWGTLNDANRYATVTDAGAPVSLTLRADHQEDHLIYDAAPSLFLRGLAEGEPFTDQVFYAVSDSHGALGIGKLNIVVVGLNSPPTPQPDPGSLGGLFPLLGGSNTLASVLAEELDLMYTLPPSSGATGRVDLLVRDRLGILPGTTVLNDFWVTDEDTPLVIVKDDLLRNDADIDRIDALNVVSADARSREGAVLSMGASVITFVPGAATNLQALSRGEMRIDTFNVVVSDGRTAGSVTSLVAVLVLGLNETPVAKPDTLLVTEDDIITFNPMLHPVGSPSLYDVELDRDGRQPDDRLSMLLVSNLLTEGQARVDIQPNEARYDALISERLNQLADWQSYTDSFVYTITDNSFLFVVEDDFDVPAGSEGRLLDVLANDRDLTPQPGTMSIIEVGPTLNGGQVSLGPDGQHLLYDSPPGFVGEDHFYYTVLSSRGDRRSAHVRVRSVVPQLNGILNAVDDHFAAAYGEMIRMDVLANDNMLPEAAAGLILSTNIVDSSVPGQPLLIGNAFVFTATNGLAPLTFTYEISAGGSSVARANVVLDVIDRRGTLDVRDDAFGLLAGSVGNTLDVLSNDGLVTASTAALRIKSILSPASFGVVTTNAAGTQLVYTPNADFIGVDHVQYLATDTLGGTGSGVVSIAVGTVSAATDFFSLAASATGMPVELDVLVNDRILPFPTGAVHIVSVGAVTNTAIGQMHVNAAGNRLAFTPNGNLGQVDFDYVVADLAMPARQAIGRATVATVAPGIYANADRFLVRAEGAGYALDVLANDISYPTAGKSYTILSLGTGAGGPSAGGSVGIVANRLVYTPAPGFVGEERFTYLMSDSVSTASALVTVSVRRGDLMAGDDYYTVYYEVPSGASNATAFTLPVALNDRIQPALDQVLAIVGTGVGTNAPSQSGALSIGADGLSLLYRPVAVPTSNYVERFTYEISDGTDRRASAVVRVLVRNRVTNLQAVTQDDRFTVERNSLTNRLAVLANDFVLPGAADGWRISAVSSSTHGGTLAINGARVYYSPPVDFVGLDEFTYQVNDGLGGTGSATVRVRVGNLPTVPDLFTVLSGSALNECDVVLNDALFAAYRGEYRLTSLFGATKGGLLAISTNNRVLYTPKPNYVGSYPYTESFFYRVSDDADGTATGRVQVAVHKAGSDQSTTNVTLFVAGRNDAPVISNTALNLPITDKQSTRPFLGVTVVEVDQQTLERIDVQVAIDNPAKGFLADLGLFRDLGGGLYGLTNVTSAAATVQIRHLVFMPTENRITVPTTEMANFTVTVTDNKSDPVLDALTIIPVTATNDPPRIAGTQPNQEFYYRLPVRPFSTVFITEVDDLTLQPLTITVTVVEPMQGSFTNPAGFSVQAPGVYVASNLTAAVATTQLRAMEFTAGTNQVAVGGGMLTHFRVAVDDRFASPVVDTNASVLARNAFESMVRSTNSVLQGSFGQSVGAIANFAVVGAQSASPAGTASGSALVYRRVPGTTNTWVQWRQLQPSNVTTNDRFGWAVSMTDDRIAVGAVDDDLKGSVYLFERNLGGVDNWGELTRIAPTNLILGSRFGQSVSLDGDLLAVGAPNDDLSGTGLKPGTVLLFGRNVGGTNAWGEITRWAPTNAASATARVGWSVALSGPNLVVGADQYNSDPNTGAREGAAFYLSRDVGGSNQWGWVQTITATETNLSREFGWSVSSRGQMLVIGAPGMQAGGTGGAGKVFIYGQAAPLSPFALLTQLDRRSDDERRFGNGVSIDGNRVFVGAPHSNGSQNLGAAYLFDRVGAVSTNWVLVEKFTRPAGSPAGLFGTAVSLNQGTGIVGAPVDLALQNGNGYAFLYRFGHNTAPVLRTVIPDQYAVAGLPFAFAIPPGTFWDADADNTLALSVAFPQGSNDLAFIHGMITGTPVNVEATMVEVSAADGRGGQASTSFKVFVARGTGPLGPQRAQWNLDRFAGDTANPALESSIWGGLANPDRDAMNNDQEYVFGGDPNVDDVSFLEIESGGLGSHVLRYTRRWNDPALTFFLIGSSNLTAWVDVSSLVISEVATPLDAEREEVVLHLDLLGAEPFLFYRVRADW